jgi:hypothetical protein
LRGEADFLLSHISSEKMGELFRAVCVRSGRLGFTRDKVGWIRIASPSAKHAPRHLARGQVSPGIIIPRQIIDHPFQPPKIESLHAQ